MAGLGLVGAGYAGIGGLDVDRDESGAIAEAGELGAFRIRVGDCVNNVSGSSVESVEGVPCDQPHEAEAYHAFNLPEGDGSFPGQDVVGTAADQGCYDAFQPFVGIAYESSVLEIYSLVPSSGSWSDPTLNDREVLCFVIDPNSTPLVGTAEGQAS